MPSHTDTETSTSDATAQLRTAIEGAIPLVARSYLSMLLVALYLTLMAGSTTDAQLLRGSSLPLPVIGVNLPIVGAYLVAPWFFALAYLYFVIQLIFLANAYHAYEYHSQLDQAKKDSSTLPRILLIQTLVHVDTSRVVIALLQIIYWTTIAAVPILVLLLVQIKFLPYHDPWITATHQAAVLATLALVWIFFQKSFRSPKQHANAGRRAMRFAVSVVAALLVVYFTLFDAVVPREAEAGNFSGEFESADIYTFAEVPIWRPSGAGLPFCRRTGHLTDCLFRRYLDLRNERLAAEPPPAELLASYLQGHIGEAEEWSNRAWLEQAKPVDLSHRDLRFAVFQNAWLGNANLTGTDLRGANLVGAALRNVKLANARLEGQNLRQAQLEGADLTGANLSGSDVRSAQLSRAKLDDAVLYGVDLRNAKLVGASLKGAQLHGANLDFVDLRGADLSKAALVTASLDYAVLQAADIAGADLTAASIEGTDLRGVHFSLEKLQGAVLKHADLRGADVSVHVCGTDFAEAKIEASLFSVQLEHFANWDNLVKQVSEKVPDLELPYLYNGAGVWHTQVEAINRLRDGEKRCGAADVAGQAKLMPALPSSAMVLTKPEELVLPPSDANDNVAPKMAKEALIAERGRFLAALPCAAGEDSAEMTTAATMFTALAKLYVFDSVAKDQHCEAAPVIAVSLLEQAKSCGLLGHVKPELARQLETLAKAPPKRCGPPA